MFNLCTELLGTSQMSSQILMNIEIGHLLNQSSGCSGCIKFILRKNPSICDAEILH